MADFLLQFEKRFRLEIAEREIFQLAANQAHAEPVGDRRINIERLAGDALLPFGVENIRSVRMLCRRSASLTITTRTSLTMASSILRTFSAWRASGASRSSRLIFVTPSTSRATSGPNISAILSRRNFRVFDDVVEQRGAQRGHVEPHVRQQVRDFEGMREVGLARKPRLRLVLLGGEIVGAAQKFEVVAGAVPAHLVHQLDEAQIDGTPCGWRNRRFRGWFHRVARLIWGYFNRVARVWRQICGAVPY